MTRRSKQSEMARKAQELGFKVELTHGSHYKVHTPMGPVFMPASPSENKHGWRQDRNRLRKHGVAV